jgi:pimeloyl-ACP methyl ester carboxylesterase
MTPKAPGSMEGYSPALCRLAESMGNARLQMLLGTESVYTATLAALLREVRSSFSCPGKTLLAGVSAGGYAAWTLLEAAPELFDAALLMAPAYLPPDALVEKLAARGLPMLLCHGRQDEMVPFAWTVTPHLPRYEAMPNLTLYLPELVMNRDGSVASNLSGIQMGQHCINSAVQNDLLFADGTPMCPLLPEGVTGWIRRCLQSGKECCL